MPGTIGNGEKPRAIRSGAVCAKIEGSRMARDQAIRAARMFVESQQATPQSASAKHQVEIVPRVAFTEFIETTVAMIELDAALKGRTAIKIDRTGPVVAANCLPPAGGFIIVMFH